MRFLTAIFFLFSTVRAQIYSDASLNAYYQTPAGWAVSAPSPIGTAGTSLTATRVGLQPVYITFFRFATYQEADFAKSDFCFNMLNAFYYNNQSTQSPIIPFIMDTTFLSGLSYATLLIKQIDKGVIAVNYTASYQNFFQTVWYVTTESDYLVNRLLYFMNWENTRFLNLSPVLAKKNEPIESSDKLALYNLVGQRLRGPANAPRIRPPIKTR